MGEQSSRDAVLAGVRRANAARQAEAVSPFAWPASPLSPSALVERFVAHAEAAQASVFVTPDFAGAVQRVADILAKLDAQQAVVSDDAWSAPWDIGRLSAERRGNGHGEVVASAKCGDGPATTIAKSCGVGITGAAYGMAETGTIVVCSGQAGGRVESLLPPVHIALLKASDLVPGLPEVLAALDRDRRLERSSAVTFITGPSRTADIELTLTIGVHGPKQLFIVMVDDRQSIVDS
jgi:L-lactate dehydrogenase complex protein LldG